MLRRVLIGALLAGIFAAPAPAASTVLMPGVTYQKRIEFTAHGPVVLHVLTAPKPGAAKTVAQGNRKTASTANTT